MRLLIEMLKKRGLLFPPSSFSHLSLEVSIKNSYHRGKILFLTCRCVDKRKRKLGVGNKLAESTIIHLAWLKASDSCFHRNCVQEVSKRNLLSCNKGAALVNLIVFFRLHTYIKIQIAFCSPRSSTIYVIIWPSYHVCEIGVISRWDNSGSERLSDLSKAKQLESRAGLGPTFSSTFHVLYTLSS